MALRISSIASSASSTGILKAGSTVTFTVGLNQPAVVSGVPVLLLNDGGVAVYDPILSKPGSVPAILYFHYTVRSTDATSDLTVVDMSLAGGSVHSDGSLFLADPKTLNVGSEPGAISAADLDGDHKTDLVVSNYGDGTVSVLLNQGIPALNNVGIGVIKFGPAVAFAAGSHTTDVAVGDIDGDTFPDLIVTDASSNQIAILKGDGRGNFTPLSTNPTGPGPVSVTTGLIDKDRNLDVVVANNNKTVSVLFGNGAGAFYKPEIYTVGSGPESVKLVDVNGDGKPDIILVDVHSNTVSVLLNDGTGTFGSAKTYHVGSGPTGLIVADLNGDGKLDLAVTNINDDTVSVLLGDGDGGFGDSHTFDTGDQPVAIAAGDMNGDRKIDLVTANKSGTVSVLQGIGDGTFVLPYNVNVGDTPASLVVADLDGDGLPDVAVADTGDDTIAILQNASVPPGDLLTSSLFLQAASLDTHFVVQGAPPKIVASATTPTSGSFGAGTIITVTLTFSETVTVTGAPLLTLNDGGTAGFVSGSGTTNLVFRTTVAAGQNAANLAVTGLTLPGAATIFDVAGNLADLSRAAVTFNGLVVDTTAPTITADVPSAAAGKYGAGQVITLTLTGSQALTVSGTPTLVLNDGGSAIYTSGSGTASLAFRYTVAPGQNTANLAVTGATLPSGATIRDAAGNNAVLTGANTTFTGLQIDTTVPVVTSVTASPGTGQFEVGQTITFTLTFSELVKLSGNVVLNLNDGGTATYTGGTAATTTLTFQTTVLAGQNASALTVSGVTIPAGAYIRASAGSGANAYLGGAVKTFGGISVDTSGPTVRSLVATPSDATLAAGAVITLNLVMSKIVSVTGGIPTLALNDGAVARYVSGSGTNTLVFTTTVVPGQTTPDLAATSFNLNGALVVDSKGRVADMTGAVANPAGTLEVSAAAVTVMSVMATPSVSGPLGVGQTVIFDVSLGRVVTVAGAPTLTLSDGGTASYDAADSSSEDLVFRTTVAAGQNAANLAVTGLTLNGATVVVPDFPLSFTAPTTYLTTPDPTTLIIADVNGDGQPDLVVSGADVSVLLGDGNGGFFPATSVASLNSQGIAVADMNHDGNLDIIAVSLFNGLSVAPGDGTGGFGTSLTASGSAAVEPDALAVGDVNGDGTPDVVTIDNNQQMSVMIGDGAGGFGAQTNFAAPVSAFDSVALADVNGDGKLDAVIASRSYGVSVLLGNGTGGFGAASTLKPTSGDDSNYGVVVADFNGDGRPDIASTSRYSVSVWLGQAGGGFAASADFPVTEGIRLATADVNGDGNLDFVFADNLNGGLNVMLGDGSGGFGALTHFASGIIPVTLAVGDVNNDGRPDIVTTNEYAYIGTTRVSYLSVDLNTTIAPNVFDPAGAATADGAITGIVVDTTPPVIVLGATTPLRGSYDVGQTIAITLTSNEVVTVIGAPILTLNDGGTASYVGGSGTTHLLFRTTVASGQSAAVLGVTGLSLPAGTSIRDAAGNDANVTGAVALFPGLSVVTTAPSVKSVVANPAGATLGAGAVVTLSVVLTKPVSVSLGGADAHTLSDGGVARYMSGSGTDTLVFSATVAQGQATADLAVTAFNLNGAAVADRVGRAADLSAAVANPPGTIVVSTAPVTVTAITATPSVSGPLGTGQTVTFTVTPGQPVSVTGTPTLTLNDGGAATYDAAASTPTSLVFRTTVTAGQYSQNLTVTALSLNGATIAVPGGLSFGPATGTATVSAAFAPSTPALAVDLNRDGIPDSIVVNPGSGTVSVRLFDAVNNQFGTAVDYTVGQNPQSVTLADVNLDGTPDLLVSNYGAGTVSVLLGTGGGQFAAAATIPVNGGVSNPRSVTAADTNGDGKPDLLVATGTSVALLLGDGTGGFSAGGNGAPPTGATVADVNGDGIPDAIVTNAYVNTVSVLLGTGSGGFGPAAAYAVGALPRAVTVADVNGMARPDLDRRQLRRRHVVGAPRHRWRRVCRGYDRPGQRHQLHPLVGDGRGRER